MQKVIDIKNPNDLLKVVDEQGSNEENNSIIYNIVRRFLSISTQCFGLFNSINMVISQASMLSAYSLNMNYVVPSDTSDSYWNAMRTNSKSPDKSCVRAFANSYYDYSGSGVLISSSTDSYCCSEGIDNVTMSCPYTDKADYWWFMSVWCILWAWVICFQLFYNIGYDTNDLRYYLSLERCKAYWVTRVNFGLILVLSLFSLFFVLNEINDRGDSHTPAQKKLEYRMAAMVACIVNLSTVFPLISTSYPDLKEIDMRKDFPSRVELKHGFIEPTAFNLYGAFLTTHQVFNSIEKAIVHGYIHKNDDELETIGPAEPIKLLMSNMTGHLYKKIGDAL